MKPLVLCYHAVSDSWRHLLSVPAGALEAQLDLLIRRGFRPVSATEAAAGTGKLLHVTFDDALTSVRNVLPVLERTGAKATVFACTAYASDGRPLAVPELEGEPAEELETMQWDELRELAERGIEIGSHTVSHPHLPRLSDAELADELRASKQQLEDELRRPCPTLAYPFGDCDDRVRSAARAAGYETAFGLPGDPTWRDRFDVFRVGVWNGESPRRVGLKASSLARSPLAMRMRVALGLTG
ncbi:MAG TPA: polysaccharide deacetylase family protein [Gaiellaceae bacterium]|nr:polysaccharide deacetylase family protein [Gaiellaceae bacterium]